jgi:hypothetical protein
MASDSTVRLLATAAITTQVEKHHLRLLAQARRVST